MKEAHSRAKRRANNRKKKSLRKKRFEKAIAVSPPKNDTSDKYPANIKRDEFGFPIESKFGNIEYMTAMMKCVMLPKSHLLLFYRMMRDVHNVFEKYKIPYFADGGTLLGAIRHKGLIPWDDDLDIGILPESKKAVMDSMGDLEKQGYGVSSVGGILKVYIVNKWIRSPIKYSANPTLDVFVYHKKGKFIQLEHPGLFSMWPTAKYSIQEFYPLRLYDFGPFQIYGACDGVGYCDRIYPGWDKIGVVELRCGPTVDMSISKNKKVKLPLKLLQIFIPEYNVTMNDVDAVLIDTNDLVPKCIKD